MIKTTRISEIFSSLQGEGIRLGERHLFIRFEGCNLHCHYCDERGKAHADFELLAVMEQVRRLEREEGPHAFVSLTGGEPLCHIEFLKALCPEIKAAGFKIYLETNGILWQPLTELLPFLDTVAMDMKLGSVSGERSYPGEHRRFLEVLKNKKVFVKMVIAKSIDADEFEAFCDIIRDAGRGIPLILQPISEAEGEGHDDPALMRFLAELQRMASVYLDDVRIVPRLHKILKIR